MEDGLNYLSKKSSRRDILMRDYPSTYNHLMEYTSFLDDSYSFFERKYYFLNKIDKPILCPICGRPIHIVNNVCIPSTCGSKECYSKNISNKIKLRNQTTDCLSRISQSLRDNWNNKTDDTERVNKIKQTKLSRYGDSNYNNKEKLIQTLKNRTKEEIESSNNKRKLNRNEEVIKEKRKNTMIKKYGVTSYSKTDKYKLLFQEESFLAQRKLKEYNTKKKNKSFNISRPEDVVYEKLVECFNDVKRQYKSNEYPFVCDFYIPSMDLYIECNFHWTHGFEPYNCQNENHNNIVNKWKEKNTAYYNNAIRVWTINDVNKRNIARNNNLKWIEFFNISEFEKWIKKFSSIEENLNQC